MTKPTAEQIEWAIESANNVRHTNSEEWLLAAYTEAIEALRLVGDFADGTIGADLERTNEGRILDAIRPVLAKAPKEDE